ncbi:hypothetical protein ACK9YZ_12580 [Rhizobium sp. ZK1]|uniref:hypothetical protein n=1 Tax=Rhizobium sp. ZK1 TaxID=3389872 RepID=UPI0039F66917
MKELIKLLDVAAWPFVALVAIILFRVKLDGLFFSITDKIRRSNKIKASGLGISFELMGEVIKNSIAPGATYLTADQTEDSKKFDKLVSDYDSVKDADPRQRARLRKPIADELGELAVALQLDRKTLAQGPEGKLVALATAIILKPNDGDLDQILEGSKRVKYKYTAYRLVLGVISALRKTSLTKANKTKIASILAAIEDNANSSQDSSLQNLINKTRRDLLN